MRRIELIGNLGKDAEIKHTDGGTVLCTFSVAAKGSRKEDESEWYRCTLFGKRGESLVKYLTKGQRVFVRGDLRHRSWESGDRKGLEYEVTVDEVELIGDKRAATEDPFAT